MQGVEAQPPNNLRHYAGRWVALVQGRVVGVGLTAEAARVAAQLARPKEKSQVIFVPDQALLAYPDILNEVQAAAAGARVWLVGGAIRDALLNRRVRDLDFAVDGDALAVARRVASALDAAFYPLDADRSVGRVICTREDERFTLDFARLRGPDLAADLAGRDFTLNAIAAPLAEPNQLIDPLGGEPHVRQKLIVACSPSAFADDPVRGIRAIRLAAQLDFRIEKDTRALIKAHARALAGTSPERQRDEFIRCLAGPKPASAARALEMLGLLNVLVPELAALKGLAQPPPHTLDAWEHTLQVLTRLSEVLTVLAPVYDVDSASDVTLGLVSLKLGRHRQALGEHLHRIVSGDRPVRWLLMLAALLHDMGKSQTGSKDETGRIRFLEHEAVGAQEAAARLAALRFSTDEVQRLRSVVANHMRPRWLAQQREVTRRAVYRFFRDTGEAGVDIVLLSLADYLGKFGAGPPPADEWGRQVEVCAQLLTAYFERREVEVAPPALISGHDLMSELGMEAGPALGEMLEAVREAQAAGEITDRTTAIAFVRQKLATK